MTDEESKGVELDPSLFVEETPEEEPKSEPAPQPEAKEREPEPDVPDKYRGKSAMELIKMHQDAERLIGKQGNEVGELRKIADDLLKATQAAQPSEPAPQEPETDFFADPKEATRRTIKSELDNDPDFQGIKQELAQARRERSAQALLARHPDAGQISQDPKFGEWVSKSKVRMKMFEDAHVNFDSELASELFDLWKDRKEVADKTAESAKAQRQESVTRASTGSGKSSSETRGKPILSRERLIDLRINNPDRYYAQMEMIKEAYKEGRVR
jgi:hypothetical protein